MFSPDSIKKGAFYPPRKVIIYGPPKGGKSTLVGATKNALMIPTEDRVEHIDCQKTPVVTTYEEILEIFDFLITGKHTFKRVILDTLDEFEPMLHDAICRKNGWTSLVEDKNKEVNFQKGMKYHAVEGWRKFLRNCDVLRENGIDVIFVAHSQIVKVNPPDKETYDKYSMKIDQHAYAVVEGWADVVGFYDQEIFVNKQGDGFNKRGKAVTTNKRILHLAGNSAAMSACNSYGFPDIEVDIADCEKIMEWLLTAKN